MSGARAPTVGRGDRPALDARLAELCGLVAYAGGHELSLQPEGTTLEDSAPIADGWVLAGEIAPERLEAAARLIRRLYEGEREIDSLCSEILLRYEEAALLYRLSDRLGSILGESAIAGAVLEDAACVLGARRGEIWVRRDGSVVLAAAVPDGCGATRLPEDVRHSALDLGRPWMREAAPSTEAAMAVALPGAERPIGVLLLEGRSDGRSYRTGEEKLLTALASIAASYIRNDRLVARVRRADARKREDEIARQIHRRLLPQGEPRFPGLDISGACRAAGNIGGDYYGYLTLPDGSLGLAIADISGHGVGAALYMAGAKGALQSEGRRILSPSALLQRVNEALAEDFSSGDVFATSFFARIHPGARLLEYSNAGHNPPLLFGADGNVEELRCGGAALGLLPEQTYGEEARTLATGDVLVLFTDGLVEARDEQRRFYGMERLRRQVDEWKSRPAVAIRDRILDDLIDFCGGASPQDDVTLVVVRAVDEGAPDVVPENPS